MSQIIPNDTAACKNFFSDLPVFTRNIPKFHRRLAKVYYDDRLVGIDKSNRSLEELARRFDRRPDYISKCLCELVKWGWLKGDAHGSGYKKRWITCEAFFELEHQNTSQITSQIIAIPYIDLSEKEKDHLQITKQEQNCGKLSNNLDNAIHLLNQRDQEIILSEIKRSKIGPVRSKRIVARVVEAKMKKPIYNLKNYVKQSIFNHEKEIKELKHLFALKGMQSVLYSTDYLNL